MGIIAAIVGRRIAATVEADPGEEAAALRSQLDATQGEVRRLVGLLRERDNAQRDADEEIVRLRAANLRLANKLEALEPPARYGPTAAVAG